MFAEAGGFVLLDPARLAEAVPDAHGRDLLELFATSEVGDEVARSGVIVPVLGADPGYYDLHVHGDEADGHVPSVQQPADLLSDGWVLHTETGELFLDPLAALVEWDAGDERHQVVHVPPGSYAVQLRGYVSRPEQGAGLDGSYAWVLRRTNALGWFTADVGPTEE